MSASQLRSILCLSTLVLAQGGCGWVDATGKQNDDTSSSLPGGTPVPLADEARLTLMDAMASEFVLSGRNASLRDWSWEPGDDRAELRLCNGVSGFDAELARSSLAEACAISDDGNECELAINEFERDGRTGFRIVAPALRAPFAAIFTRTAIDDTGAETTSDQLICGVSINEAPTARNDRYEVEPGTTLTIVGGSGNDLLSNDDDDDDVRNQPLAISTTVVRQPRHAELFELGVDGGFRYRPEADPDLGDDGLLEDSFAYTVTDGMHPSIGQVVIVIGARNRAPTEISPVPGLRIAVVDDRDTEVSFDLSRFFNDPDGDTLRYELDVDSLLIAGRLMLDSDGRLGGSVSSADEGSRVLGFSVSDGRITLERRITINVVRIQTRNNPPVATDIDNRRVTGRFSFDVSRYFSDPDGDRLTFTAASLPRDVTIDANGTISGRAQDRNDGIWFIVVTARDESGASASDGFLLRIDD